MSIYKVHSLCINRAVMLYQTVIKLHLNPIVDHCKNISDSTYFCEYHSSICEYKIKIFEKPFFFTLFYELIYAFVKVQSKVDITLFTKCVDALSLIQCKRLKRSTQWKRLDDSKHLTLKRLCLIWQRINLKCTSIPNSETFYTSESTKCFLL